MRSAAALVICGMLVMAALVGARQAKPAPTQTFRAGVDLIQLDVSVLDQDRHPVTGLATTDFSVLVDGQMRPVVAFKAVEIPKPVTPSTPWMRDVAPDVTTNTHPSGRVVVIMIDDGSFTQTDEAGSNSAGNAEQVADLRTIKKARDIAKAAVNELGPDDLAAVVYTENNHTAQSFTTDRHRLIEAIDKSVIFPGAASMLSADNSPMPAISPEQRAMLNDPLGILRGSCGCGVCSIEALSRVAQALRSLPQQRKVVIDISAGVVVTMPTVVIASSGYADMADQCAVTKRNAMIEAFRQAQLANVTIESVDPKGLVVGQVGGDPATNPTSSRIDFLRTTAETTGGRAIVNDNEMEKEIPAIFAETGTYYLLGVESPVTKDDGRFHPVEVRVDRPGLEVRTRNGFYAPTEKERKAMSVAPAHGVDAAIAGVVPKADFPMDVTVAPFASSKGKAELAIVLNVTQPNDPSSRGQRRTEPVDVVVNAFAPESGKSLGSWRQRIDLVWNPTDAAFGEYEVLSRVPVETGRYELRLGLETGDAHAASVYTYAEVPDFSGNAVSLSGLILSATPSPKVAPKAAFADLMPVLPTARRVFRRSDRVAGFLRVYEGGKHALVPATIKTRLVDSKNAQVGDGNRTVDVASFGKGRSYDDRFDLPVRLPPDEYLLTVDVEAGGKTAERTLRFKVQ